MSLPDKKIIRAFMTAAWNGQTDLLEKTLAEYPDAATWKHPEFGKTGLANAIASGALAEKSVPLLLAHGADINAKDGEGRTPLMLAADNGSAEYARLLLGLGADTSATNNLGVNAVEIARKKGNRWSDAIAEMIAAHDDGIAENKRRDMAQAAAEMTAAEAAQAHSGLEQPVRIGKPFQLKR